MQIREVDTPAVVVDSLPLAAIFVMPLRASTGIEGSRSGYEAAENRQKGADSPIFSLLKAIFKDKQYRGVNNVAYD